MHGICTLATLLKSPVRAERECFSRRHAIRSAPEEGALPVGSSPGGAQSSAQPARRFPITRSRGLAGARQPPRRRRSTRRSLMDLHPTHRTGDIWAPGNAWPVNWSGAWVGALSALAAALVFGLAGLAL